MSMLQSIKAVPKIFRDLACFVLQRVKLESYNQTIKDDYPELSIKNPERAMGGTLVVLQKKIHADRSTKYNGRNFSVLIETRSLVKE